jgi:ABC-2 type transport system ATP-binding protein
LCRSLLLIGGCPVSAVITIDALVKKFGGVTALNEISLEIEQGELFGLLGPNGAGKTTLISILATILKQTSGTAMVCGRNIEREQAKVRKCIGIVFQDPSLDEDLTGEENLDFHGRLYGLAAALRLKRIDEVLELVDLKDRKDYLVKTYSGGMRRRLEIARGLMHMPQVLFLDEPTLGLDPQTRRKIWAYIGNLKEVFGTTIILTTHYMDEADQLCSRIAIIDSGRIVALDTPQKLKARLGGDLLELEVSPPQEKFADELVAMEGVQDVALENGRILLTVNHGEAIIPRVFQTAQTFGVAITSVSMRKPNLEDVFIELTGKEIRDSEVAEPTERMRILMLRRRR